MCVCSVQYVLVEREREVVRQGPGPSLGEEEGGGGLGGGRRGRKKCAASLCYHTGDLPHNKES